jgi:hypothetical protein
MRRSGRRKMTWQGRALPLLATYLALVAASSLPHCHAAEAVGHGRPAPQIVCVLQWHHEGDSCPVCRWQSATNSFATPGVCPEHIYRYAPADPAYAASALRPSSVAPRQNRAPPPPA